MISQVLLLNLDFFLFKVRTKKWKGLTFHGGQCWGRKRLDMEIIQLWGWFEIVFQFQWELYGFPYRETEIWAWWVSLTESEISCLRLDTIMLPHLGIKVWQKRIQPSSFFDLMLDVLTGICIVKICPFCLTIRTHSYRSLVFFFYLLRITLSSPCLHALHVFRSCELTGSW